MVNEDNNEQFSFDSLDCSPNLFEFNLGISYPITIHNYLPSNLSFKFLDWGFIPEINESENISQIALSTLGAKTIRNWLDSVDVSKLRGRVSSCSKENCFTHSPHEYPLLCIEDNSTNSRGIIKLNKKVTLKKQPKQELGTQGFFNFDAKQKKDNIWYDNKIVHFYNTDNRLYQNYFV